jgi:ketosteroid isomerase-like protein
MAVIQKLCTVLVLALSFATVAAAQTAPPEERKADHDALRAILTKSAEALNTRKLESVADMVHPAFTVITVDNQKLVGLEALRKYYAGLFDGPGALLSKLEVRPVADELTRFVSDTSGVVYGVSDDIYTFRDGDVRTMKTRWSAMVQKDGGAWKLVNVHFSANLLDNPMLDAAKGYAQRMMWIAGAVGLVLGALLTLMLRRRPR